MNIKWRLIRNILILGYVINFLLYFVIFKIVQLKETKKSFITYIKF